MVSCEKISDDANAELKSTLAGFFESVKKVKRTEDNFRDVMKGTVIDVKETMGSFRSEMGDVKNLEAEMADASVIKDFPRRKDNDALESNIMQGFKNEEIEREKVLTI